MGFDTGQIRLKMAESMPSTILYVSHRPILVKLDQKQPEKKRDDVQRERSWAIEITTDREEFVDV
jgi:hypothetical protein